MRGEVAEAVKAAMKAGDKTRLSTLRLISAKFKDADLAVQRDRRAEASSDELTEALARMVKQRRESIEHFKIGNRADLVAQEEAEIAIIQEFLPKGLSEAETADAIAVAISETGAKSGKDMSRVMALLKERYTGRMDFGSASKVVKSKLS
jgi:uncharacterized protein YqeY